MADATITVSPLIDTTDLPVLDASTIDTIRSSILKLPPPKEWIKQDHMKKLRFKQVFELGFTTTTVEWLDKKAKIVMATREDEEWESMKAYNDKADATHPYAREIAAALNKQLGLEQDAGGHRGYFHLMFHKIVLNAIQDRRDKIKKQAKAAGKKTDGSVSTDVHTTPTSKARKTPGASDTHPSPMKSMPSRQSTISRPTRPSRTARLGPATNAIQSYGPSPEATSHFGPFAQAVPSQSSWMGLTQSLQTENRDLSLVNVVFQRHNDVSSTRSLFLSVLTSGQSLLELDEGAVSDKIYTNILPSIGLFLEINQVEIRVARGPDMPQWLWGRMVDVHRLSWRVLFMACYSLGCMEIILLVKPVILGEEDQHEDVDKTMGEAGDGENSIDNAMEL